MRPMIDSRTLTLMQTAQSPRTTRSFPLRRAR